MAEIVGYLVPQFWIRVLIRNLEQEPTKCHAIDTGLTSVFYDESDIICRKDPKHFSVVQSAVYH